MIVMLGMLWLDNNPETTFEEKIKRIKSYFNKKYADKLGLCNVCYVNPLVIIEETIVEGIKIKADKYIMEGLFWVGNDKTN